jgi:hypothetical protein
MSASLAASAAGDLLGHLLGQLHGPSGAQARAQQRHLDPRVVDLDLHRGDPPQRLRVDVPESHRGRLIDETDLNGPPYQPGDGALGLHDRVPRLGPGEAEGLHDPLQGLHRQATLFACPREADLQDIDGQEGRHRP